jgi:hypothetical protein
MDFASVVSADTGTRHLFSGQAPIEQRRSFFTQQPSLCLFDPQAHGPEVAIAEVILSPCIFPGDRLGAFPEDAGTWFWSGYPLVIPNIGDEGDDGVPFDEGHELNQGINEIPGFPLSLHALLPRTIVSCQEKYAMRMTWGSTSFSARDALLRSCMFTGTN